MIELIKPLLTIDGEIPSKANLGMNYKLKNVPLDKIKNKNLRETKQRWEHTLAVKDQIAWTIKSYMNANGVKKCDTDDLCFIHMLYYFQLKKSSNPANLRKDTDNVDKLVFDAIQASGIIHDDKQVVFRQVGKLVTPDKPRLEIISLVSTKNWSDLGPWLQAQHANAIQRVYPHALSLASLP